MLQVVEGTWIRMGNLHDILIVFATIVAYNIKPAVKYLGLNWLISIIKNNIGLLWIFFMELNRLISLLIFVFRSQKTPTWYSSYWWWNENI